MYLDPIVNMFSCQGRSNRCQLLIVILYNSFVAGFLSKLIRVLIIVFIQENVVNVESVAGVVIATIIIYMICGLFTIPTLIKRLHDMNMSGWLLLLFIVPFVNLTVVLMSLFFPGDEDKNKYGVPPHLKEYISYKK